MTFGLSILGLFSALLGLAVLFQTGEPNWFGFGVLAAAFFALGAAFSRPHLRTGAPWAVGTAFCIWGLVGLGDDRLGAWAGWATFAFGLAYLALGAQHFLRRAVPAGRLPRFLRPTR